MSIFEQASRLKLRFRTPVGLLTMEDLWDLPLTSERRANLNDIAIDLHNSLEGSEISFVDDAKTPDPELQLSFDIVRHIIGVKKTENKAALEAREKSEKKQKMLGILARKEDAALEAMEADKLRELIAAL